jgi:transcription-repair coupling factor (superfamily II helicase)
METDWKNELEVITRNTEESWDRKGVGEGGYNEGFYRDEVTTQVKRIREVLIDKFGEVNEEVNKVLNRYEMGQEETCLELDRVEEERNSLHVEIEGEIRNVEKEIVDLLEK